MTSADFQELIRAGRDPWYFLTQYVHTLDPARGVAAFPEWSYLHHLVEAADRERFLLVPKSRQMLVTWTMVALMLWRALFRERGMILFLSRNERCAEELLERARFILDHLPAFMRPKLTANSRAEIAFAVLGSRILSLPASPNGPRMYSPNAVFWDEMAFTPYDEAIWAALKPALDSGGRFVGISSSGGANNLFARFVTSLTPPLAGGQGGVVSPSRPDPPFHPPVNEGRLFHIHRIHYSMHPERRSDAWKKQAMLGLSTTRWRQEQEISFEAMSDLVYDEFDPRRHVLFDDWLARTDWGVFRSIDFGYRHPFVLWLQQAPDGEIIVFDEWSEPDRTTDEMLRAIRNVDLRHGLRECDVMWTACDPAGAAAQDAGLSPVDLLRRAGMKLRFRPSRIASGVERVKSALLDAAGRVNLRIAPRCRQLIHDFSQYRWAASGDEPLKDGLSDHSMDALRYFFVNLDSAQDEMIYSPRLAGMRR